MQTLQVKKRYISMLIIIHIPKTSECPYCNKKKLICFVQYFCNRNKKGIPQNGTPLCLRAGQSNTICVELAEINQAAPAQLLQWTHHPVPAVCTDQPDYQSRHTV